MSSYSDLLKAESSNETFDFERFINSLNEDELHDFLEDVFTETMNHMRFIFPTSKNITTHDIVFHELVELPYITYESVKKYLDMFFLNAVNGKQTPNTEKVINNILGLTRMRKDGVSSNAMKKLLKEESIDNDLKLSIAFLLSKVKDKVSLDYWDTEIDYNKCPYLIPAYISAYKKFDPVKALYKLIVLKEKPENFIYFRSPITSALEELLIERRLDYIYLTVYSEMLDFVKSEFDEILNTPKFKDVKKRLDKYITKL